MIVQCLVLSTLACLTFGLPISIDEKAEKSGCTLKIKDDFNLPYPEPLLLKRILDNDGLNFHLPSNTSGIIDVAVGEVVRIGCAGDANYFIPVGSGVREVNAICKSGTKFFVEGRLFDLQELTCYTDAYDTARYTGEKCNNDNKLAEIGFQVRKDFIRIMDICFDDATKNTLWSKYQLVAGIVGRQEDHTGNAEFLADSFYPGISPSTLYSRDGQRQALAAILGSVELVDKYINKTNGNFFLSRGHLTARADFVYFAQHLATYHFINVAPQWQTFNGGNWEKIETSLRTFASFYRVDLVVYTGTHGVTTLPNILGVETPLWLYVDKNNNKAMPVPMLYWKVAFNPKTEQAVALIGVNNPHVPNPGNDEKYKICPDVCSQIKWLKLPTASNVTLGYSYCCEVDYKFRDVIKTLPLFNVTGLLTG